MTCETCSGLRSDLDSRERQFEELRSKFAKQKLQSKAKVAQLRHELAKLAENGGPDSGAALVLRLEDTEDRLRQYQTEMDELRAQLLAKDTQIADHVIRIKILEQQSASPSNKTDSSDTDGNSSSRKSKAQNKNNNNDGDAQKIYAQLVYKDTRILELNNTILDKDRQVLDLQELCREQREVAQAKAKAVQILQDRIKHFEMRETKESATETSELFVSTAGDLPPYYNGFPSSSSSSSEAKITSPGRAIVVISPGHERGSPPPVDPSEDRSSVTTETGLYATAGAVPDLVDFRDRTPPPTDKKSDKKSKKKRVTFDLTPKNEDTDATSRRLRELEEQLQNAETTLLDLTGENDELRSTIADLESVLSQGQEPTEAAAITAKLHDSQIEQLQKELDEAKRDGKNQTLKAKAAAQSRIKDLEERMASIESAHREETDRLRADVETIESARTWALEENARLIEEVNDFRTKHTTLREEYDLLNAENEQQKETLGAHVKLVEELTDDLEAAQRTADALLEQKQAVLDDVDRLKEALEAQEELIETLEGDLEVYQQQIEMLRDSLGEIKGQREDTVRAEKNRAETRSRLKGKAYETKLRALEQEKEQLNRQSTSHRLKTKAFDAKIRSVEKRNLELQRNADDATAESNALRLQLEAAHREVAQLTADVQTKSIENENLRTRLDEIKTSNETIEKNVQILTDEKTEIETELQGLWDRERQLKTQLADAEQTQRQLQKERAEFRAQCKELIQSETSLTERLTSVIDERDKLRAEHAKLKDRSDVLESGATVESRHLADELQKLRGHFEAIERERLSLENELAQLRLTNADLTDDVKTSRAQFAAAQTAHASAEEKISALNSALDQWRCACEKEQTAVADLQSTNAALRAELDEKCAEVDKLTADGDKLRAQLHTLESSVQQLQAAIDRASSSGAGDAETIAALTRQLDDARLHGDSLLAHIAALESQSAQKARETNDALASLQSSAAELEDAKLAVAELRQRLDSYAGLESKCAELESQLIAISDAKATAENASALAAAELHAKHDEIVFLRNELEQVNDAKVAAERTLLAVRDDLRAKEEESALLRSELDQVRSQNEASDWGDQSFEVQESTLQTSAPDVSSTKELERNLTEIQSQLAAVSEEKTAAEKALQSKDDEIVFLQGELEQVNDAKIAAEKTLLAIRNDLRAKEEKVAFLQDELDQVRSQNEFSDWGDQSFEVRESTQQSSAPDVASTELKQHLTKIESQLATVSEEKAAAEEALQSKDDEIVFLKGELEQVNDAKIAAEKTLLTVRNDLRAKEEEIILLRGELDQAHSQHTIIERKDQSASRDSEQQLSSATATITDLRRSLADVESQLVVVVEEKAAVEKSLLSKDEDLTFLREELEQARAENAEVEQWGRSETHELESQLATVTGTVTELRATIDAKEREVQAAKDQLRKIKAAAKALTHERDNHRAELAGRDEKLMALSNLLNEKSAELAQTQEEHAATLAEHQSTINSLRSRAEELENELALKESRVAQLQVELNGASRRLEHETQRRAETTTLEPDEQQSRLDLAEEELAAIKRNFQITVEERDKLAKDRQSLCQEILDLNDRAARTDGQLEAQSIVIDGLNQSIEALIAENEELKSGLNVAENEVAELQSVNALQKTESDSLRDKLRSAVGHLDQFDTEQQKTTSLEEENQLLRQCLNDAKQSGVEYADRIMELEALTASQHTAVDALKAEVWALESKLEDAVKARDAALESLHLVQADFAVATDELNGAKEMERELLASIDVKNRELAARQDELEAQMRLVERARQSLASAENELNIAQLERNRLVEEMEVLRNELASARAAEQQLSEVVDQKTKLEGAYQELATYYSQLQVAYTAIYQKMEDGAKKEKIDVETGTDEGGEDVDALMTVVDELKTQLTVLESELIAAENDNRMQKSRCQSLYNALVTVKAEVATFKTAFVAEKANLLVGIDQLGLTVVEPFVRIQQEAMAAVDAVRLQDEATRAVIDAQVKEAEASRDALAAMQNRLNDTESMTVQLQSSLTQSEQAGLESRTNFEAQLRDSLDEMRRGGDLSTSVQQRITEAEQQIAKLNESLRVAVNEAQQMQLAHESECTARKALQEQLTQAEKTNESLVASLESAQQKLLAAETEAASKLENLSSWSNNEIRSLQTEVAILVADLTTRTADNDGLFRANAELARNGKDAQDELDLLTERLEVLSEENDSLKQQLEHVKTTADMEYQRAVGDLRATIASLTEESASLKEQFDHAKRAADTEYQRVVGDLRGTIDNLTEEKDSLKQQLDHAKTAADADYQRIASDLQETIDNLIEEKTALGKKYSTLEDEKRVLEATLATLTARLGAAESQQRQAADLLVNVAASPPSSSPPQSLQSVSSHQQRTTLLETDVVLTRSATSMTVDSSERRVRLSYSPTERDPPFSSWGQGPSSPVYSLQRCESAPDGGNISIMQMLDDESLSRMELFKSLELAKRTCRELACENRDLKLQLRGIGGLSAIGDPETNRLKRRIAKLEQKEANYDALIFMKDELVTKIREMEANCDRISSERKDLLATIAEIQQRLAAAETEKHNIHESFTTQVRILESRCTELSHDRNEMEVKYVQMRTELEEHDGAPMGEERAKQLEAQHTTQVQKLEAQIAMVKNILEGSRTQLTESESRVRQLESQYAEKLAEVDALKSQIGVLQSAIEDATSEKTELTTAVEQFRLAVQERSADADRQEADLRNEISSHASATDSLKTENSQLTVELSEARQFAETLHIKLRAQIDERNACYQLLEQSRAYVAELEARLEQENEQRHQIQTQLSEKSDAFEALTQKMIADDSAERLQAATAERHELSETLAKATANNDLLSSQCAQLQTLLANAEHVAQQLRVELDAAIQTQRTLTDKLTTVTEECSVSKDAVVRNNETIELLEGRLKKELSARDDLETRLKETTVAYNHLQQQVAADDSHVRLKTATIERDELKAALEDATVELNRISEQLNSLTEQHSTLQTEAQMWQRSAHETTNAFEAAQRELDAMKSVHSEQHRQSANIKEEYDQLVATQRSMQDCITQLNEEKRRLAEENEQLVESSASQALCLEETQQTIVVCHRQLKDVSEKAAQLETKCAQLLSERAEILDTSAAEKDKMIAIVKEKERLSEELNDQLRKLRAECERLTTEYAETDSNARLLRQQLDEKCEETTALTRLLQSNSESASEQQKYHEDLMQQLSQKDDELSEIRNNGTKRLAELENENEQLTSKVAEVESQLAQAVREAAEKVEELSARTVEANKVAEECRNQLTASEERCTQLTAENEEHSTEVERLSDDLSRLRIELERTTASMGGDQEQLLLRSNEYCAEIERLKFELAALQLTVDQAAADNLKLSSTIEQIEAASKEQNIERDQRLTEMERMNEELAAKLNQSASEREQLDAALESARQNAQDSSSKVEHLKSELSVLRTNFASAFADKEAAEEKFVAQTMSQDQSGVAELRTQMESNAAITKHLEIENVRLEEELFDAHTQLEQMTGEADELGKALQHAEASLEEHQHRLALLDTELINVRQQLDRLKNATGEAVGGGKSTHDAERKIVELECQLMEMTSKQNERFQAMVEDLHVAEDKVEECQTALAEKTEEVETLRTQLNSVREENGELLKENESLMRFNDEVQRLQSALEATNRTEQALRSELADMSRERDELQSDRRTLSEQLEQTSAAVDDLRKRLRKDKGDRTDSAMRFVQLEAALDEATRQLQSVNEAADESSTKLKLIEDERNSLKAALDDSFDELSRVKTQLTDTSNLQSELENQLHDAQQSEQEARNSLELKTRELMAILEQKTEERQRASDWQVESDSAREQLVETDALRSRNARLEEENSTLSTQLEETQQAVVTMQYEKHELVQQLSSARSEEARLTALVAKDRTEQVKEQLNEAARMRDDAVREVGLLREQVSQFKRQLATYELKVAERDVLAEQVKEMDRSIDKLKSDKEAVEWTLDEQRELVAELRATIQSAERDIIDLNERLNATTDRESTTVGEMRAQLQSASDRIKQLEESKAQLAESLKVVKESHARLSSQMTDWASVDIDNDARGGSPVDDVFATDTTALIGAADRGGLTPATSPEPSFSARVNRLRMSLKRWTRRRGLTVPSYYLRILLVAYVILIHLAVIHCYWV